ncbi:hypothetical protein A6R68_18728, partial [Neotoma lepida]
QPPFSGPFYRWQPCRLGVLRATGTSGYGHRSLRKQVWSLSTASNAFFAHPSASKENTPRKSQAGRGHGCCSPYKPIIYQPPAATFSPVSMLLTFPHVEFSELLEPPVLPNLLQPLTLFPSPKLSSSAVLQSCLAPIHLEPQPTEAQAYIPALPAKLGANLRKPWGDAKKYGKVYGMDHRGLWYTAYCWKNACQHFLD